MGLAQPKPAEKSVPAQVMLSEGPGQEKATFAEEGAKSDEEEAWSRREAEEGPADGNP